MEFTGQINVPETGVYAVRRIFFDGRTLPADLPYLMLHATDNQTRGK